MPHLRHIQFQKTKEKKKQIREFPRPDKYMHFQAQNYWKSMFLSMKLNIVCN